MKKIKSLKNKTLSNFNKVVVIVAANPIKTVLGVVAVASIYGAVTGTNK